MKIKSDNPTLDELLQHADWVRDLARKLVVDANLADDLAQETWVSVLRAPPPSVHSAQAWLRRVLQNTLRNRLRGERRRARREQLSPSEPSPPTPDELIAQIDSHRLLVEELQGLPEPYASTLILRFFRGMEPSEIATLHGENAGTVRWRIHHGIAQLRERLDRRSGGDGRNWLAMMVPLAQPTGSLTRGATVTTFGGLFAVSSIKIALGSIAAALLLYFVWPTPESNPTVLAPVAQRVQPQAPPNREPVTVATSTSEANREEVLPGDREPTQPLEAVAAVHSGVRFQVIDDHGSPLLSNVVSQLEIVNRPDPARTPSIQVFGDGYRVVTLADLEKAIGVRLVTTRIGHTLDSRDLRLEPGQILELGAVTLRRAARVFGHVVDDSGVLLPGIPVQISGEDGENQLETTTDALGEFAFEGVAPGFVTPSARWMFAANGTRVIRSAPTIQLRAGDVIRDVVITLPTLHEPQPVSGLVLDATGTPAADVEVRVWESHGSEEVTTRTDDAGHFSLLPLLAGKSYVEAEPDRNQPGASSRPVSVKDGTTNVVLRLREKNSLTVRVIDGLGDPIEHYDVAISPVGSSIFQFGRQETSKNGIQEVRVPESPFLLAAQSIGTSRETLGPFDPFDLPEQVEMTLYPARVLRGRVTVDGAPASRAYVKMIKALPPGIAWLVDDFLVTIDPKHDSFLSTRCDEEGRFSLTVDDQQTVFIRAEVDRVGVRESELIHLDHFDPDHEVQLALARGGTIEGKVIPFGDRSVAGVIIGASTATGMNATTRSDESGRYRLEGMPPGIYEVREAAREIMPLTVRTDATPRPIPSPAPWDVVVTDGAVTFADVQLGSTAEIVLSGSLTVDGAPPGHWGIELYKTHQAGRATLDLEGHFRMVCSSPGPQRVLLRSRSELHDVIVVHEVDLARGETSWNLSLETGTLTLDSPSETPGVRTWLTDLGDSTWAITPVRSTDANISFRVPAGDGWLLPDRPKNGGPRPDTTRATASGHVKAGGTLSIE